MPKKAVKPNGEIRKYSFKDGLPIEFEVVSLRSLYDRHRAELTAPHRTSFFHVLLFGEGASSHNVDFNSLSIQPGSLVFLNRDVVQQFNSNPSNGIAILFSEDFFVRSDRDKRFLKSAALFNDLFEIAKINTKKSTVPIPELIKALETEATKAFDVYQSDILHNYLANLLLYSEREYRLKGFQEVKKSEELDNTLAFKELVEKHFKSKRQVSFFAEKLNMTEKRLNKATTTVLGKTPKDVINDRVLLECKRLLSYSSLSVKEIGYELGFDEPTNFNKYFKKYTAATLVEFRDRFSREE
jgi:AraC family transcriptional activator of pobA